jgi:ABC-type Mn2+/Zn2+ transport system ATPase subunit/CheY-like chemotaxis protein
VTAVIETEGLGKRYRKRWALAGCTLSIPVGHVVGLVGPNGAGKTTLINLATGMLAPTTGTIKVLGGPPVAGPAQLARVGYLAQDAPVYAGLPVADHLRLGAHLNPGWDAKLAQARIDRLDLDPKQKAGTLSGGQRAQLALTLAVAKRPELLILDEPVASLDPLARRAGIVEVMGTRTASSVGGASPTRLIIIDDHEITRAACTALLRAEGTDVIADLGSNGQAITAVRALRPDVAIIDVTPAAGTGFVIADQLRALPIPPIVILTSSTDRTQFGARLDDHLFIAKADICAAAIARLARTPKRADQNHQSRQPHGPPQPPDEWPVSTVQAAFPRNTVTGPDGCGGRCAPPN